MESKELKIDKRRKNTLINKETARNKKIGEDIVFFEKYLKQIFLHENMAYFKV